MPTPSVAEILQCVAKVETVYGQDAAPVGGTDDALLYESSTPVNMDASVIRGKDHGTEFTHRKATVGMRANNWRAQWRMQGTGALGATANGFSGQAAIAQCCGITQTLNAGTSIVWTPAARAALKSASIWFAEDGERTKLQGCYGSLTLSGDPEGFVLANAEGLGKYNDPEDGANGVISGYVGGASRSEAFLNAQGTINNGSSMTNWVFDSFNFKVGASREKVRDANAQTGLHRILYTARDPDLEIVVMLDTDAAATIPYKTFHANMFAHTTHAVTFGWGTSPNRWLWSFPQAQLINVQRSVRNGYRIATMSYLVQHSTDNAEFSGTCS